MNLSRLTAGLRRVERVRELPRARRVMHRWPAVAAAYCGLKAIPDRIQLRDGNDLRIESLTDLATFWNIFISETYPVRATDRRIIDVGANVGFFTLYAASVSLAAEIASIEPHPQTFSRLEAAIRINRLFGRVHCFQAALRDVEGTAYIDDRLGVPSQFRAIRQIGIEVHTLRLSDVLDHCGWGTADLLKIDAEGSEYEALLASSSDTLRRIRRITMEYHPRPDKRNLNPHLLFSHLRSCGFRQTFHRPDNGGYGLAWFENCQLVANFPVGCCTAQSTRYE